MPDLTVIGPNRYLIKIQQVHNDLQPVGWVGPLGGIRKGHCPCMQVNWCLFVLLLSDYTILSEWLESQCRHM